MLAQKGVALKVSNRSVERGEALAHALACPFIPLDELQEPIADLLIQTTSVGMTPQTEESPVPKQILQKGMVVMDIIYNPLETMLLRVARESWMAASVPASTALVASSSRIMVGLPITALARAIRCR